MKSDIQVRSKIKVIDKKSKWYRWRGTVSEELTQCSLLCPDITDTVGFVCTLHFGEQNGVKAELKPEQIACIQKK